MPIHRPGDEAYLPLSVAAAEAFTTVRGDGKTIRDVRDYSHALNVAAAALARLIPVYVKGAHDRRRAVRIDPALDSFTGGATRLRHGNGTLVADLSVARSDLSSALARLRAGAGPLFAVPAISPKDNRILAALPEPDYARLERDLELVTVHAGELMFGEHTPRRHVHFPVSAVISLLYITADGAPAEIAVIGNDSALGLALVLGAASTPRRAVVRVGGNTYRVKAQTILEHFRRGGALQAVLLRHVQSLINQMAQTAVCYRHHSIEQQLCRWLLVVLDRSSSHELPITQEVISQMLGVRRSGVSEAAKRLQSLGAIEYSRGRILVRERAKLEARACECYATVKREAERVTQAETF